MSSADKTKLDGMDTAISTAISTALGQVNHFKVVDSLPATGEKNAIYLVPNAGSGNDTHDEYIWTGTEYERIGTTNVDLTSYATKEYLANTYATKEEVNNANTYLSDQVAEIEAKAVGLDDGVINVVLGKDDDGLYLSYEEETTTPATGV